MRDNVAIATSPAGIFADCLVQCYMNDMLESRPWELDFETALLAIEVPMEIWSPVLLSESGQIAQGREDRPRPARG